MSAGPWRLDSASATLLFGRGPGGELRLLHFGPRLAEIAPGDLPLVDAVHPRTAPERPCRGEVFPGWGFGFPGEPAVLGERDGRGVATHFRLGAVEAGGTRLVFRLECAASALSAELAFAVDAANDLFRARTRLENRGGDVFALTALAASTLPLPAGFDEVLGLVGRWAGEFRQERQRLGPGAIEIGSRRGRTGLASQPTLFVGEPGFGEDRGEVVALHLAWSGDHRLRVERLSGGELRVWLGENLLPGEVRLAPGASVRTPEVFFAWSGEGTGGISRRFHAHLRARHLPPRLRAKPRPVHLNTWEAVYFRHDPDELAEIARAAAALGVERFVLDDGWFEGRDHDRAGLGDWRVDPRKYPEGLGPLADLVRSLGMEFGLWVEPEMVSPESALYREHPDWCLHVPRAERPTQRHQLVLDLGRAEVAEHLFRTLDGLVRGIGLDYLKWDHNRDLFPATSAGRPAVRAQTLAFYDLLDRLRAAHPQLEIESCASGGGRVDLGVLARAERFWASDNNDAVDRVAIQRGASLIYPLETMGCHVGPRVCHVTGRCVSMLFRTRVALFGHMGLELDPRGLDPEERTVLAGGIALYRRFRGLLHSGRLWRQEIGPGAFAQLVLAEDGSEALLQLLSLERAPCATRPPVRLGQLPRDSRWRLRLPEPWPEPAARELADPDFWRREPVVSAAALAGTGISLPLALPETAWLVHLERVA